MTPERARMLLHAHIDGEIDATSTLELKSEMEASPALRQEMERLSALHHVMQTRATRFNAPSRLSKSVHTALSRAQTDSMSLGVPSWWRTLAIGSSAAAVALLLWASRFYFSRSRTSQGRYRGGRQRPCPFSNGGSSDRSRVDGSPFGQAVAIQSIGFRSAGKRIYQRRLCALGGRLDYIAGKPAAAIVYRYRQHIINLFVWVSPVSTDSSIRLSTHRGYNSANFESAGMSYWTVSDLNQNDLGQFAKLLQRQSAIK